MRDALAFRKARHAMLVLMLAAGINRRKAPPRLRLDIADSNCEQPTHFNSSAGDAFHRYRMGYRSLHGARRVLTARHEQAQR